jgi:hypothetical protein
VLGHPLTTPARAVLAVAALVPAAMSVAAVENRIRLHRGLRLRPGRALALGGTVIAATVGLALAALQLPIPASPVITADRAPAEALASGTATVSQLQRLVRAGSTSIVLPAT